MGSHAKRFLAGCALLLLLTLLAVAGVAQVGMDPRNDSDKYLDAQNGASCYAHHGGEGFRPFDFFFENTYTQLPIGEDVEIVIRVRHPSIPQSMPNPQEFVEDIAVTVDTSEARNVRVITQDAADDLEYSTTVTVSGGSSHSESIQVASGAQGGHVTVHLGSVSPVSKDVQTGTWTATVAGRELEGDDETRTLQLDAETIQSLGVGEWEIEIEWDHPLGAFPFGWEATFELEAEINYGQEATEFRIETDAILQSAREPVAFVDILIPVRILSADEALLDFRIEGTAIWTHQPGDGAPRDDGVFYRFMTMRVVGGDELVEGASAAGPVPVGVAVDLYNMFNRLTGMIALFLVLTAMVTGGVFGRKSRRWMNQMTGGAKKRVLWHSAAGFLIVVVATLHFAVALLDTRNDISKGLFWGGVAWVLLVSLGFTGYYQVRMIKRWNYRVWRHTHLWSSVALLIFMLFHTVLDGAEFAWARDLLPGAYERLIWPRAPGGAAA